jgi:UDP-N-acetylmuramate: L-alanyl-gamma-D-glutamyl-meso-diaminopimelate ligase
VALITGIAYDHVNVYPTFEDYLRQFEIFIAKKMEKGGTLIYHEDDPELAGMVAKYACNIDLVPYRKHPSKIIDHEAYLVREGAPDVPVRVFGTHNLQNISGAFHVCLAMGIRPDAFYEAIKDFRGAARRLELIGASDHTAVFYDFAHSPSKLKATISAVKEQYPERQLMAVFELHTFSSQNKKFLAEYHNTMQEADECLVYFDPAVIRQKKLQMLDPQDVEKRFGGNIKVFRDIEKLKGHLSRRTYQNTNVLFMTSGHFSGMDINKMTEQIIQKQ